MSDTLTRTFTFKRDEDANTTHTAKVTVPATIGELPKSIQAALYSDALANVTIKVQGGMRRWIKANETATPAAINAEAQSRFDEALKGTRRATVIVETVQLRAKVDATAMALTGPMIAHFSADPNVELVNVPEKLLKYVVEPVTA
jgi:hypothetical protein